MNHMQTNSKLPRFRIVEQSANIHLKELVNDLTADDTLLLWQETAEQLTGQVDPVQAIMTIVSAQNQGSDGSGQLTADQAQSAGTISERISEAKYDSNEEWQPDDLNDLAWNVLSEGLIPSSNNGIAWLNSTFGVVIVSPRLIDAWWRGSWYRWEAAIEPGDLTALSATLSSPLDGLEILH